jgi:PhzF family phenazine biosynthesis protein
MPLTLYVVDAFTPRPFTGNPAAVCLLPSPLGEGLMQQIAREMNLSETAFLIPLNEGFALRWFTPAGEVKLCGHATLASAHTLWSTGVLPPGQSARFSTQSGWLTCRQAGDWIEMDFPAQAVETAAPPAALLESLHVAAPVCVARDAINWLVELADERAVRELRPDFQRMLELPAQGVIVTARSESPAYDFVSRYFAPAVGVNEDPVTGSAHCTLGPYWQSKLGKPDFIARQVSARGGVVKVSVRGPRVLLSGQAVSVSRVQMRAEESDSAPGN